MVSDSSRLEVNRAVARRIMEEFKNQHGVAVIELAK
jgi:uncharacterized protein YlxP (DUF503 family)